ncbi:MAG: tRNA (guanosine(37)-N1)-methyltransferase TrmD, partial [Verrucomicrobiota bacterium]
LGDPDSPLQESFTDPQRLEAPQYTRPATFQGHDIPEILLSGHHENIATWREEMSIVRTKKNRPDLL